MIRPLLNAVLTTVLLVGPGSVATAAERVNQDLLDELTGIAPNPDRKVEELEPLYLEAFSSLTRRFASKTEINRTMAHEQIRMMISRSGQPGREAQAKVFAAAVATHLRDKEYPSIARYQLIRALGSIGTIDCLPRLAGILASDNPVEANLARMSLQQIPGKEIDAALISALEGATSNQVMALGLIDSLATRKPDGALAAITPLLESSSPEIAAAAAAALGRIGGGTVIKSLAAARAGTADETARENIELAMVEIAYQRMQSGDPVTAGKIFKVLGEQTKSSAVRLASMFGLARAQPKIADAIVIAAVRSEDPRIRSAGISASTMVPNRRLSAGLAAMLETAPKLTQLQILNALAVKRDISVQEKVLQLLGAVEGKDKELELACIRALGPLGSVSVVETLLKKAISKTPSISDAAKASLGQIRGNEISQTIEFHARQGKTSEIRAVAVGLFMRNRDRTGLTRMLDFATEDDSRVSAAALSVLRSQAGDSEFRKLLDLMTANRMAVLPVLTSVCGRAKNPDLLTGEIITFLRGTENPRQQRFLMSCLPILGSNRGLPILIEHIGKGKKASDPATKALSNWPNSSALPEMLKLLKSRSDDKVTVGLMVKGISRLVVESEDQMSLENRVRYITEAFEVSPSARERMVLLPVMSQLPHDRVAEIVAEMLKDRYVAAVAANTAASLCEQLIESDPDIAKALALSLSKGPFNSIIRERADAVLKKLGGSTKGL